MPYAAWSVIAGETPTATKWNILGTNDSTFDGLLTDIAKGKTTGIDTLVDGATVTVAGGGTNKLKQVTIENDRALAISGMSVGQSVILRIVQGTGGGHTITSWFTGATVRFPGGVAPELSTDEDQVDTFVIMCTATDTYEVYPAGNSMDTV